MVSNKHAELRKVENFVRSIYYHEDIAKDKRKKANFRKSCNNFKLANGQSLLNKVLRVPKCWSARVP